MSIFKKILSKKETFFSTKKLIYTAPAYEIFTYNKNNETLSLIKYTDKKDAQRIAKILRTVKHYNVMNVIKSKDCCIYTSLVVPYRMLGDNLSNTYKEYLMISLANALQFLHEKCKIVHDNLNLDALLINSQGALVLSGFECAKVQNGREECSRDFELFEQLSYSLLNTRMRYDDCLNKENFYSILAEKFVTFNVMGDDEIVGLLNMIRREHKANDIPEMIKMHICRLVTNKMVGLTKEKDEKAVVDLSELEQQVIDGHIEHVFFLRFTFLYFMISLEMESYDIVIEDLFSVLDTKFRVEVLKKRNFFMKRVSCWDRKSIFYNLTIGLKCKDKALQTLTLEFVNDTVKFYNFTEIKELCKLLSHCKCVYTLIMIENNLKLFLDNDMHGLYKLMFVFIHDVHTREQSLILLDKIYKNFSFKKLSTEILPFLCELIVETDSETLFMVIKNILGYLESNREAIANSKITTRMTRWLPFMSKKGGGKDDEKQKKFMEEQPSVTEKDVDSSMKKNENWDNDW
ncbi:non-specific serine/threonine protein kinase [Trachipleistophora hominis]|uniref:Non-specific serine/threonine protein kinase n=1 Tax=Trachipleistophora hominis TaxID=72359 RepID=L7JSZ8_TRAHO|nr:non-specific serine/threonine protein kinase [Trachipleistophora hominis]